MGPNGAGKTSVLRRLAAQSDSVGVVFQDLLLFPKMNARDNVAFGLRCRGTGRAAARQSADELLEALGVIHRAHARPDSLSGGEAQRVALARALVTRPKLLLLDEPFAALDAHHRAGLRTELQRQLDGYDGVTVLVTHDALDAMVLADRVIVLEEGREVQSGAPRELARRPRTRYVASLFGLNLLRGVANGTNVWLPTGETLIIGEPQQGEVLLTFAPHAVSVHGHRPEGSPRNVWRATIAGVEQHGELVRVSTAAHPDVLADLTRAAADELRLRPGSEVWLSVKATEIGVDPV
jgi:molybdate transport system ATP-binding protein